MIDWESLKVREGAYLPHWTCENAIYHVVFRLADSLPKSVLESWSRERDAIVEVAQQMRRGLSETEEKRLVYLHSENVEKYLDAGHGECLLMRSEFAELVANALKHFDGERYRLHAWCLMPNHVHIIVDMIDSYKLSEVVHSWKSFTSNIVNRTLGRNGQLWQREAYDHIIRSEKEYRFQLSYVLDNPAKAGLKNWLWVWPKL